MKKIFYVLVSSALVAASVTSCKNVEESIWEESSIERLEQTQEDYAKVLESAANGWEMQYFPTAGTPGYVFAVKFDQNGSVVAAANNKWTEDKYELSAPSTWGINIDNGPVLSFNSYNSIIHFYSDPNAIPGTSYGTGLGMEGDYEFIMIDVPEDGVIVLKGKKRGTYAYLKRIPEGTDWEQYLASISEKRQTMLVDNPSPMMLTVGDKRYNMWYKKADDVLNIVEVGGDTITQEKLYHYVFNTDGMYLLEPFDLDGAPNLQWFDSNEAEGEDWKSMTMMVAKDDIDGNVVESANITAGDPLYFFNMQLDPLYEGGSSVSNWNIYFDEANMSAENIAKFKAVDDILAATFNTRTYRLTADYATVGTALEITLARPGQTTAWIKLGLDRTIGENSVVLNAKAGNNSKYEYSVATGYDVFFNNFMNNPDNIAALDQLMSIFSNAEFSVDYVTHTTLRNVKMTDMKNENSWMIVESSYIRR